MPTQDQARALLQRLADDPAFREKVKADPASTLPEYGFKIDPANMPKAPIKLPAPEEIRGNLDRMSSDLAVGMAILFFEA
jgi:putative modified peptide